jgi:hypothetical protein
MIFLPQGIIIIIIIIFPSQGIIIIIIFCSVHII